MLPSKPLSISREDSSSDDEHQLHELDSALRPRRAAPVLVAPSPSRSSAAYGSTEGINKQLRSPYEPECQGPLPHSDFIGTQSENSGEYSERDGGGQSLNGATVGRGSGGGSRYVSMLRLPKVPRAEDANKSSSSAVSMLPNTFTVLRADLNRLGASLSRVEEQLEQQNGAIKNLEKNSSELAEKLPGRLDAFRGEITSRISELAQGQVRLQREVSSIQGDVSALKTSLTSMQGCTTKLESSVQQLMVTLEKIVEQSNRKPLAMGAASPELASSTNPMKEATASTTETNKPAFSSNPFSFASAPSTTPNNFDFTNSTKPAGAQPLSYPFSQPQEAEKGQNSKPAADLSPPPRAATESAVSGNSSLAFPNPFMKPNTTPAPATDGVINAQGATGGVDMHTAGGAFSTELVSNVTSSTASGTLLGTSDGKSNPFGGSGAFAGAPSTGTTAPISPSANNLFSGDKPKPPAEGSDGSPHSAPSTKPPSDSAQPSSTPFSFGKPALPGAAAPPPSSAGKAPLGPFSFAPAGGGSAESANPVGSGGATPAAPAAFSGFSFGATGSGAAAPAPEGAFRAFAPPPPGAGTTGAGTTGTGTAGSPFGSAFPSASRAPGGVGTAGDTASGRPDGLKGLGTASAAFAAPSPFSKAPAAPALAASPSFGFGAPPTGSAAPAPPAAAPPFASNLPPSGTVGGVAGTKPLGTPSPFSFGGNPSAGAGASSTFGSTAVANTPFGAPASNATGSGISGRFTPAAPGTMVPSFAQPMNNTTPFGSGGGASSGLDGGANGSQILGTKKRRATNRRY